MAATAEKLEVKKKVHTVLKGQIGLAESKRHDWVVDVGPEVDVDEITDPEFWAHVAEDFQALDLIEVRWMDHSKIVTLRVLWCERAFAKVCVVHKEEYDKAIPEDEVQSKTYRVQWKGPSLKFCVIRNSDERIIQDRLVDKTQGYAWIRENDR